MSSPVEDDFGFDSADEAELLKLAVQPLKRKADHSSDVDVKRARCASDPSIAVSVAHEILKSRFGLERFRLQQEAAITRLLEGESATVVFPTGGGKSLCYQLPALCFKELDRRLPSTQTRAGNGITLVVSPLIALMKDQVDALRRRGISAAVLDSTRSREEYLSTVEAMRNDTLDILYCAPERLNNEAFVASMAHVRGGVRLLAVDEAHCISEWGHAFRPDYLKVARFAREITAERVVCLTATATPGVAKDVCKAFDIPENGLFRTSSYRSNLRLYARSFQTKAESYPELRAFLKSHPGPTIIYVTLQKQTEDLAASLRDHGFKSRHFHAGMDKVEKSACQDAFMASNDLIIVATIAFGMGIDKADIRNVIHYDVPRSLEGYSQEIGRAGRDGKESFCMLYLCAEDLHLRESFARGDLPSKSSVEALLHAVLSTAPTMSNSGAVIESNVAQQSKTFNIKVNVLNNIYAQLELRFGLLRAVTPKYTSYSYVLKSNIDGNNTPAAKAIRQSAKKASTLWHVDVDLIAKKSGLARQDIITQLQSWHDQDRIELRTGGVVNIYRILQALPTTPDARQRIADDLYADLVSREAQDLQRMASIIDLITDRKCFAKSLTQHFGDTLPGGSDACGHCTWCETGKPVPRIEPPKQSWNTRAFNMVLEACPDRDDPRHLTRIAFGIHSPRITQAKLSKHAVFGSMEDHNFMSLLNAFTKVCSKDG